MTVHREYDLLKTLVFWIEFSDILSHLYSQNWGIDGFILPNEYCHIYCC